MLELRMLTGSKTLEVIYPKTEWTEYNERVERENGDSHRLW